jgi:hypothetical protein
VTKGIEAVPNAGWSTCPLCGKRWLVTPLEDCMVPDCGCFGNDTMKGDRPCERCGFMHGISCPLLTRTINA